MIFLSYLLSLLRKKMASTRKRKRCNIITPSFLSLVSLTFWNSVYSYSSALAFYHHATTSSTVRDRKLITIRNNKCTLASLLRRLDATYNYNGEDITDDVSSVNQQQQRNVIDVPTCLVSPHLSSLSSSSHRLPPWLELLEEDVEPSKHAAAAAVEFSKRRIQEEIERLEHSLLSFRGGCIFSKTDVTDIIRAIYWCASDELNKMVPKIVGSVAFCILILQLEEEENIYKSTTTYNNNDDDDMIKKKKSYNNRDKSKNYLVTKDILLGSILHFSECVNARYDGFYEEVQQAFGTTSTVIGIDVTDKGEFLYMPSTKRNTTNFDMAMVLLKDINNFSSRHDPIVAVEDFEKLPHSLPISLQSSRNICSLSQKAIISNEAFDNIFTIESLQLAEAASRLKRCEILTSVVLSYNSDDGKGYETRSRRPVKKEEYADIRNLMVSLTDDWRALAIRCVASLFRLEGALKKSNGTVQSFRHRNPETTLTAKDSLQLYANLSQQMGLHRLRSQIEAKAFRILYPRQYTASSTLFQEHGVAMEAISAYLSSQLEQILYNDRSLMFELENLQVLSRVKEPFSFWKKLLKRRFLPTTVTVNNEGKNSTRGANQSRSQPQLQLMRSSTTKLSIMDVNDGVALRVILKARKLDLDESDDTTRGRERILCYYIHHFLRSHWPETDPARVKDFIRYPKRNGYQSLHHTSRITRNNQDFFFEVQIRSEEMDRLAEFGVAAHSTYKLGSSYLSQEPPSSHSTVSSLATIDSSALVISSNEEPNISHAGGNISSASGPYIHALQKTRQNLVRSHVYVFLAAGSASSLETETGQLLTLSAGSTVTDAVDSLRRLENFPLNHQEVQVWCNGKIALLEDNIKNGDMILIKPLKSSTEEVSYMNKTLSNAILVS